MEQSPEHHGKVEIAHQTPKATAPFLMVYPAELVDSRISAEALKLMLWLRYRTMAKENTWVSEKTISEDLGLSERQIRRLVAELKKYGFLSCKPRGYGQSTLKIIADPLITYDEDMLVGFNLYLKSTRSKTDLQRMRSKPAHEPQTQGTKMSYMDNSNDNATLQTGVKNDPVSQKSNNNATLEDVHVGRGCPNAQDADVLATEDVCVLLEVDQERKINRRNNSVISSLNICGTEAPSGLSDPPRDNGNSGFFLTKEEENPYGFSSVPRARVDAAPADPRIEEADPVAPIAHKNPDTAGRLAIGSRIVSEEGSGVLHRDPSDHFSKVILSRQNAMDEVFAQDRSKRSQKTRQTVAREGGGKAGDVERWFREAMVDLYGSEVKTKGFAVKDKKCATTLLNDYGPDLVKRGIRSMFGDWESFRERYKVNSKMPTFGVFYGFSEGIINEIQANDLGKRPDRDESADNGPRAKLGWSSDVSSAPAPLGRKKFGW